MDEPCSRCRACERAQVGVSNQTEFVVGVLTPAASEAGASSPERECSEVGGECVEERFNEEPRESGRGQNEETHNGEDVEDGYRRDEMSTMEARSAAHVERVLEAMRESTTAAAAVRDEHNASSRESADTFPIGVSRSENQTLSLFDEVSSLKGEIAKLEEKVMAQRQELREVRELLRLKDFIIVQSARQFDDLEKALETRERKLASSVERVKRRDGEIEKLKGEIKGLVGRRMSDGRECRSKDGWRDGVVRQRGQQTWVDVRVRIEDGVVRRDSGG